MLQGPEITERFVPGGQELARLLRIGVRTFPTDSPSPSALPDPSANFWIEPLTCVPEAKDDPPDRK
ncbi:hypothetical protein A2U01_0059892, partial [Trifolium medium]|nr:hypothetical protein [Trifolium medium]